MLIGERRFSYFVQNNFKVLQNSNVYVNVSVLFVS